MSNNPFVPAEWGQAYDLAGAEWVVGAKINLLGPRPICFLSREVFIEDEHGAMRKMLPSPAWINTQADPRAVAIAYLERAGFNADDRNCIEIHHEDSTIQIFPGGIIIPYPDGQMQYTYCEAVAYDPALARYTVDCFDVLHEWAAAIKWEVQDD